MEIRKMPLLRDFINEVLVTGESTDNRMMDILELRYMQWWSFSCKAKKAESLKRFLRKMHQDGDIEIVNKEPQGYSVEITYKLSDHIPEVVKPVGSFKKFWNYLFKRD